MRARVGFNWVIRKLKEPGPILEVFEKGPWECLGNSPWVGQKRSFNFLCVYMTMLLGNE